MPRRRRPFLRNFAAGAAEGLSDLMSIVLQNSLLLERQKELQEMIAGRQREQDLLSFAQGLIPRVASGELSPDALTQDVRALLSGVVDLDALRPSTDRLAAPLIEQIEGAKTIPDLPTVEGALAQMRARGISTTPGLAWHSARPQEGELPSRNLMPVSSPPVQRILEQLSARTQAILAEDARQRSQRLQPVEHVDQTGRAIREFIPETELAGRTFFTEPTPEQVGERTRTELLAGELHPDITDARAQQEGSIAAARRRAELAQEAARLGLTSQQQTAAFQLADDFWRESVDYFTISDSFRRIVAVSREPSAAGDLSLIFAYMKLLDPASAVREGEQATAENARGVPATIRNLYNRVMSGERLTPEQRADFINQAGAIFKAETDEHRRREAIYKRRADQFGVPDFLVIREPDPALLQELREERTTGPVPSHTPSRRFEILEVR